MLDQTESICHAHFTQWNHTVDLFFYKLKKLFTAGYFWIQKSEYLSQKRHGYLLIYFFSYSPSKKTSLILMGTLSLWFCTYFQRNCVLWIKISPLWNLQPKKKYWVATLSSLFQKLLLRRICEDFWQMTSLVRCEMSGLLH